jgi:hypothetical protein
VLASAVNRPAAARGMHGNRPIEHGVAGFDHQCLSLMVWRKSLVTHTRRKHARAVNVRATGGVSSLFLGVLLLPETHQIGLDAIGIICQCAKQL